MASLPQGSLQYQRLINFVDYLSRMSRGHKILFVMIGSASTTGSMSGNQLDQRRVAGQGDVVGRYHCHQWGYTRHAQHGRLGCLRLESYRRDDEPIGYL